MKFTIKPDLIEGAEGLPVFGLTINDVAIHDPFTSDCGRFPVDPTEAYGLTMDDAMQLRDLNEQLTAALAQAIMDRADNFALDFQCGLLVRNVPGEPT